MHRGVWVIVTTTIVAVAAIVVAPSAGSPQPAVAATTPSEFWLSFLPQYDAVTANQHVPELHLSTTTPTTVTVSGTAVGADIVVALAQVDQVHVVTLPASAVLADTEGTQAAGLRIQADHPITVHGSVRRGSNHAAFLALPTDQLGNRHRVLTAPGAGAMFAVVATQDATTLTITPRVALGTRNANTTFTVALNAGQVYVLRSLPANDTDPTGTLVTSDRPVAVMAGHTCSSFVTAGCSAVAEQLPPVSRWGTDTVMARLPRFDADSNAGEAIRVVADTDNTEVFVDGVRVATLAAGQTHASYRFAGLTSAQPVVGGRVTTSAAALVATFAAQGVHHGLGAGRMGGSAFTVLAPVTQLARRVVVSPLAPSLTGYGATIALPTSAVSSLRLNGAEVPAQSFTALGATTWSAGHVTLSAASHVITAHQAMAVTVWGVGAPASGYGAVAARTLASDADEPPPTTTTTTTTTTTIVPTTQSAPTPYSAQVEVRLPRAEPLSNVWLDILTPGEPPPWTAAVGHTLRVRHVAVRAGTRVHVCVNLDPRLQRIRTQPDRLRLLHGSTDITNDAVDRPGWVCGDTMGLGDFKVVALAALRLGGATRIETAQRVAEHLHGPQPTPGALRVHPFDEPGVACHAVLAHRLNVPLLLDLAAPRNRLATCLRRIGRSAQPVDVARMLGVRPANGSDTDIVAAHRGSPIDTALAALVAAAHGRPLQLLDPTRPTPGNRAVIVGGIARLPTSVER